jgi:hypothetical protein
MITEIGTKSKKKVSFFNLSTYQQKAYVEKKAFFLPTLLAWIIQRWCEKRHIVSVGSSSKT